MQENKTTFFYSQSEDILLKNAIQKRYGFEIEKVEIGFHISILCNSSKNAREVEEKLKKDGIQVSENFFGRLLEISSKSQSDFLHLFLPQQETFKNSYSIL